MIIVSDTTAISSLHKIHQLHLLHSIFGVVIIPQQVFDELKFFEQKDLSFKWREKYPWIKTETVTDNSLLDSLSENLDEGEAAAIALTIELHADLLLIDERQGRKIALERKLNIIGVVGVIEIAKRKNLITAVKPLLDDLISKANFRISKQLYEYTLKIAREE